MEIICVRLDTDSETISLREDIRRATFLWESPALLAYTPLESRRDTEPNEFPVSSDHNQDDAMQVCKWKENS